MKRKPEFLFWNPRVVAQYPKTATNIHLLGVGCGWGIYALRKGAGGKIPTKGPLGIDSVENPVGRYRQ
jgi:hypothetical protein